MMTEPRTLISRGRSSLQRHREWTIDIYCVHKRHSERRSSKRLRAWRIICAFRSCKLCWRSCALGDHATAAGSLPFGVVCGSCRRLSKWNRDMRFEEEDDAAFAAVAVAAAEVDGVCRR